MDFETTIKELETAGTAQNRKIYKRHGVGENQYGVSYGALGKLQKSIKQDHTLALQLWGTGNHDARILACHIADPKQADDALLEDWVHELDNYVITDAFSEYAAKTALAVQKVAHWTPQPAEWIGTAGYNVLGILALRDKKLPDDYFAPYLQTIEREIHGRANRVRYAMNNALIAIGTRSAALQALAVAAAGRIGVVVVDHGETNCQTPDAVAYIHKTWARKKK